MEKFLCSYCGIPIDDSESIDGECPLCSQSATKEDREEFEKIHADELLPKAGAS